MTPFLSLVLQGVALACGAAWWTSQLPRRWLQSTRAREPFHSALTYPFGCCGRCTTVPFEGGFKILFAVIGTVAQLGSDVGLKNYKSYDLLCITLYMMLFTCGVVDVLVAKAPNWCLPGGADYLVTALTLAIEWTLYYLFTYSKNHIEVLVTTLLLYTIIATVLVVLLENAFRENVLLPFARSLCLLVQATWLVQIAYVLHPPAGWQEWDPEKHEVNMIITIVFGWHMAIDLLVLSAVYMVFMKIDMCCCAPRGSEYGLRARDRDQP